MYYTDINKLMLAFRSFVRALKLPQSSPLSSNFSIKSFLLYQMGMSASSPAVGRDGQEATSIFDFDVENVDKSTVSLTSFKGQKVYYVVNVATN